MEQLAGRKYTEGSRAETVLSVVVLNVKHVFRNSLIDYHSRLIRI